MKKARREFHFNETIPEYVIRLKRRRFPWWIFLILLLLLILLIPTKKKIEYTVINKTTLQPIEDAKVTLNYKHSEQNEQFTLDKLSDDEGYVVFKVKDKRIYQLIFSKDETFIVDIKAKAEKQNYDPDLIDSLTLAQLLDIPDDNKLKLYTEEVADVEETETPDEREKPKEGCRAFFSGGLVSGHYEDHGISEVYVIDEFSEYVGAGEYPDNEVTFPKAVAQTFDGIAIDSGTRVIIYRKKNFKGEILLDKTGPAIINNIIWKEDSRYEKCNTETFKEPLQSNFPVSCREWSDENMHDWSYGSLKVICE
jgi:hypothetical protein